MCVEFSWLILKGIFYSFNATVEGGVRLRAKNMMNSTSLVTIVLNMHCRPQGLIWSHCLSKCLSFVVFEVIIIQKYFLFQNVRPSAENLPEDLALIVTSCWKEDPNARPNFCQIIQMLLRYLSIISPPEPVVPPQIYTSENTVLPPESPGTSSLMAGRGDSEEPPNAGMEDKPTSFFSCFRQCY